MSKYTPGPWRIDTDYIYSNSDDEPVAIVGDARNWKDNAHLISGKRASETTSDHRRNIFIGGNP